jgi:hypothetical protein
VHVDGGADVGGNGRRGQLRVFERFRVITAVSMEDPQPVQDDVLDGIPVRLAPGEPAFLRRVPALRRVGRRFGEVC